MSDQGAAVPPDFASRIKSLRVRLGMTQTQFAADLGVSFASVNRWENGQARPGRLAWRQVLLAEGGDRDALQSPAEATGIRESAAAWQPEPGPDFCADPEVVRAVVEAERLTYGHRVDPTFATEVSRIDPLPHQRLAVYDHMLRQPRLRFLLADDAGAGKTIMTGLYAREMLSRRLVRRVLIVPPAGLVGNWKREMKTLFSLGFRDVSGGDARASNPFVGPDSDLVVVSVDTLAGDRVFGRLQAPDTEPYDLVVFDEAHKLSADREPELLRVRKTDRYRVAEALSGVQSDDPRWSLRWSATHLLLLTATPHMGKDFPYYCLWRLLEPLQIPTEDAFRVWPVESRAVHFLRRTKEEMVRYDGSRIYPTRVSDTLSYDLHPLEQELYERTTEYIRDHYNRARILNRSAARLAMSVFQRRLASSPFALLRSFERRAEKLDALIRAFREGRLDTRRLDADQKKLPKLAFALDAGTADEEQSEGDAEGCELAEDDVLGAVAATTLADLTAERAHVHALRALAVRVLDSGEEAKLDRLVEQVVSPGWRSEKLIVFTEHRDTLAHVARRLAALGHAGEVACIHGGMDWKEREAAITAFRKPASEGGARFLVATDAAGEGINLQFCWLMVNFDIPWNPARLEQRMGRIHRYGQKHDPVFIVNLVAGRTREGRVLKTLLDKLEAIRHELRSDKVFDVVGRLFEGVSLRAYMEQATTDAGADAVTARLGGVLTPEQVRAIEDRERSLYGRGGDVRPVLPRLRAEMDRDALRRLLPGYVRMFVERAAPLLDLRIEGDLDGVFRLRAARAGAMDPLWPVLEQAGEGAADRLTVERPAGDEPCVFLHPGEPVFERLRGCLRSRYAADALRGAVLLDPSASEPYVLHAAEVSVVRRADADLPPLAREEALEVRLVGLRQAASGAFEECAVERLLLLSPGSGIPPAAVRLAAAGRALRDAAQAHAAGLVGALAHARRASP
ncbi:MAG: helix-turn-helix domain-containing protein, partial [Deltaproteobacteria bacterium]|nr:helix-turn-helix domain-containing protein [Deltaproteobacteria bacterium]